MDRLDDERFELAPLDAFSGAPAAAFSGTQAAALWETSVAPFSEMPLAAFADPALSASSRAASVGLVASRRAREARRSIGKPLDVFLPSGRAPVAARSGFTLVEMLAVIVILALIASMVTVNWRAMLPKAELNSAVRMLASAIQSAHSEAISRNAVYRIEYDLDKHRYRINTPFKQGGGLAAREEDRISLPWTSLPETVRFSRLQIDGIDYVNGMAFVRFDQLGGASGHIITLVQKPYDNFYTIEVQSLTGLIDYHEGQFVRLPPKESDF
jgi:prepilin-type N-terminal cleavage/methylation domain-containing protein